jgi:hypothetical protein
MILLDEELEQHRLYADWPLRLRLDYCLRHHLQAVSAAHSTSCSRHPGLLFPGIKRPAREANRSHIAEVMNSYSNRRTSTPPCFFMTSRLIKHKAILSFYLRTDGQRIASNNQYGTYYIAMLFRFWYNWIRFPS